MTTADQAIKPFDPKDYVEALRAKIRGALLEIVPDAQRDAMIKAEIETFFELRKKEIFSSYSSRYIMTSGFREACEDILRHEVQERCKAALASPEWAGYWDGQKRSVGPQLALLLQEHGDKILTKWMGDAMCAAVQAMQYAGPR